MRWLAYMPLRGGSKSIPGKNIRPLAGRPLFAWSLGAAIDSGCFDEIWVGTDSDDIRRSVEQEFGPKVKLFRRGAETCTDAASTESALLEFAAAVDFDVLCTIQATSPLTRVEDFRRAQQRFDEQRADSLVTAVRTHRFFWTDDGRALNYDPLKRPRRQDWAGTLMENGAFYFSSRAVLESGRCRLGGKIVVHEMAADSAAEIDEPEDWVTIERLIEKSRPA